MALLLIRLDLVVSYGWFEWFNIGLDRAAELFPHFIDRTSGRGADKFCHDPSVFGDDYRFATLVNLIDEAQAFCLKFCCSHFHE